MLRRLTYFLLSYTVALYATAADSIPPQPADSATAETKRPGLVHRVIEYFSNSNKPPKDGKLSVRFLGGPHYSEDTQFGLGIMAAGVYNLDRADSLGTNLSNTSLYTDLCTAPRFKIGLKGDNIFPGDRRRLSYELSFCYIDTKFWGIGYDQCSDDANESRYKSFEVKTNINYVWRLHNNFFIGPMVVVSYARAWDTGDRPVWAGLRRRTLSWGPGFTLRYDTRDCLTQTHRGVAVHINQWFNPAWLGNTDAYFVNESSVRWFGRLWRGAVLATQLHGRFTWGSTPWADMSTLGGSDNMRGYFAGRYRDKNEIDVCVELRQHVYRRSGVVAWVGAASVFPRFSAIRFREILPNFGVGYRWEFRKNTNLRLDYGIGKHQSGIVFQINEAF